MALDTHNIALNAANHLGAVEQVRVRDNTLADEVRQHFNSQIQELHRVKYNLKPKIFRPQDEQKYLPQKFQTPVIKENVALNQLMFLLFERVGNLKGTVLQFYRKSEKYDTKDDFGFHLDPLVNRMSSHPVQKIIEELLPNDLDPTNDKEFMEFFEQQMTDINSGKLVGTDHNFLPNKIIVRKNIVEYRNAARNCVRSMGQHYSRLTRNAQPKTQDISAQIRNRLATLLCVLKFNELSSEGLERLSFSDTTTTYTDEIASAMGIQETVVSPDGEVEIEFASRTSDFIYVGSRYGDCTSKNAKDHEDHDINVENIFWTVASYGLDVFHQVIELKHKGSPIIKAHIMPCFFYGRLALHIDAIETVPRIRDYRSATKMILNDEQDAELMARREEFLALIFDEVERIADQMGIELVTCDAFSNTHWVQTSVHRLLPNIYHIKDFDQLYNGEFTRDLSQHILGIAVNTRSEIQAINLSMTHPDLDLGYKRNYSLRGGNTKLRGI